MYFIVGANWMASYSPNKMTQLLEAKICFGIAIMNIVVLQSQICFKFTVVTSIQDVNVNRAIERDRADGK